MWTASPLKTWWPAAGVWATMVGTGGRAGLGGPGSGMVKALTSSTRRMPMGPTRADAAGSVRPARDGMTKPEGAVGDAGASTSSGILTRRLTRGLSAGAMLGPGVWARTMPDSPGEGMWEMTPSSRPRRRTLMEAARSVWPMTLGIATCWGPRLSVMRTAHSRRTEERGTGDWASTWPGGMLGE